MGLSVAEKILGVREDPKNKLSFLIAKSLSEKGIPPTDSAILNKLDRLDVNDIYLILNIKEEV